MKDMQFRRLLAKKFHEHVSDAYCLLYLHLEIGGYFSQYANELSSDEYGDYSVFTPTERSDFLNESGLMSSFRKIEEGGFKEINKYFETANLLSVFVLMDEFLHENSRGFNLLSIIRQYNGNVRAKLLQMATGSARVL